MRDAAVGLLLVSTNAIVALFALLAVFDQSWELVFFWLGIALLIEAADTLSLMARSLATAESLTLVAASDETDTVHVPDRPRLLAVTSFLNGVFVPVVALLHAGFLDGGAGVVVATLILLVAQYRVAFHGWAVESDQYNGFPTCWGIVGFYLLAFDATPVAAVLLIGLVLVLSLLPYRWPHALLTRRWQSQSWLVSAAWLFVAVLTLVHGFPATTPAKSVFLLAAAYGIALVWTLNRDAETGRNRAGGT